MLHRSKPRSIRPFNLACVNFASSKLYANTDGSLSTLLHDAQSPCFLHLTMFLVARFHPNVEAATVGGVSEAQVPIVNPLVKTNVATMANLS